MTSYAAVDLDSTAHSEHDRAGHSTHTARSSSCQCLMTLHGEKTEAQRSVFGILLKVRSTSAGFLAVVGHSWDLDQKRNGAKTCSDKPDGNWDRTAEIMILQLTAESGHPLLRASSAFERGAVEMKPGNLCNEFKQKIIRRCKKLRNTLRKRDIGEDFVKAPHWSIEK